MIWRAPAKLNLFLHVTGRRPDGYHTLQTVYQFLDYADDIELDVTAEPAIEHVAPVPGLPTDDLCVRAARLLQREGQVSEGVALRLTKRIPVGSGLGGGSSDAATVLMALNVLWKLHWSLSRLAALGLRLGADVPVFIGGKAAWAEGVGERLQPLSLPCPWYAVVVPPVSVSTAAVFADAGLTRTTQPITIRDFRAGHTQNDLTSVVCRLFPEVAQALAWLGQFGPARMTGSGGCVYVALDSADAARAVAAACPAPFTAFVAQGLNEHPIHRDLAASA